MDCPNCGADMVINDYTDEYRERSGYSPEEYIQNWFCRCLKCGYKGTFSKLYQLRCEEWEEEE